MAFNNRARLWPFATAARAPLSFLMLAAVRRGRRVVQYISDVYEVHFMSRECQIALISCIDWIEIFRKKKKNMENIIKCLS